MSDRQYFFYRNGREFGPFSAVELKRLKEQSELRPEDLVWTSGMTGSVPAADVRGLFLPACASAVPSVPCPVVVAQSQGAVTPPPPLSISAPPALRPTASVWKLRARAFAAEAAALGKRACYEACVTAQAILLQTCDLLGYLVSKTCPSDQPPPAVYTHPATRFRAAVGGVVGGTVLMLGMLALIGFQQQRHSAAKGETKLVKTSAGARSDNGRSDEGESRMARTETSTDSAGQQPAGEKTAKSSETRKFGQSDQGVRVPFRAPGAKSSRYSPQWSGAGRKYGLPSVNARQAGPDYGAQAELARQEAINRAIEARDRATRNYMNSTGGFLGSQGLQYIPQGNSPYHRGY
jgi:hypothetical protein